MRHTMNFAILRSSSLRRFATAALVSAVCLPVLSVAQQTGQETFPSSAAASQALADAAKANDESALLHILGPEGKNIISSGDATEDADNRANFAARYEQMHRLMKEPDGSTTLYVGAENWPMPIPLVEKAKTWYFDTPRAEKEILFRRIGRNEMSTIRVCQQLVAAQKEYYDAQGHEYAQQIFSDEGQHNGLYWKAAEGQPESPIGPLVAQAVSEGYVKGRNVAPTPYLGYYYHILTAQGPSATGGAESYIEDGKMTRGFAFVAYPAEYRSSGVMTFMVDASGIIYERDLGKDTETIAKTMKAYNPGPGWRKAMIEQETAQAQPK
ncbi:MAG TPA: DUF2950 domain-containing protein [Candidatus Aquilonibacter sp.]|nr:DUF2950 domain-containing protein [Candidatus Aquilonibacter sp.]